MPLKELVQAHLIIPLEDIKLATNNFHDSNAIARGGFGDVYLGELTLSGQQNTVAIKRLQTYGQGVLEFMTEIDILSNYTHNSIITLRGICEEGGEKILVYEHAEHRSLDRHLKNSNLSWEQRLKISIDVANGLKYLHHDVAPNHRVVHRDIKSSNILLFENWEAKISDFGLSHITVSNDGHSYAVTYACGTNGYVDPEYARTNILTKESDVYSFGVVLFEILCGRLAFDKTLPKPFSEWVKSHFQQNTLHEIIFPSLKNQIKEDVLKVFSMLAFDCLKENSSDRPTMVLIIKELERALKLQTRRKVAGSIQVGTQSGDGQWSFERKEGHNLVKITIEHGDHVIYSLMFTTESEGVHHVSDKFYSLMFTTESEGVHHVSDKFGGSSRGVTDEIPFGGDEEIICINGTIVTRDGNPIISSLSFQTNKKTCGPFGTETETLFSLPWEKEKGSLVGFYGFGEHSIDGIGVYLKPYDQKLIKAGPWGKTPNYWYIKLYSDERLKTITIGHADFIYSIMFNTKQRGKPIHYPSSGGPNGVRKVEVITFDENEEIIGIHGRVALSGGNDPAISSLSFETHKKIHGPFGDPERGAPFTVPCEHGSFVGLHGHAGYCIESIGVYMKVV